MLYQKNKSEKLSNELFKNPTSEYRGAPFWAWNCELDRDELLRQIEIFKEMGLGGYHMHVRTGMATEYLSDEFMSLIKSCVEKGKQEGMISYLYDEDRWPSGAAGGKVTKEKKYRARTLLMTPMPYSGEKQEKDPTRDSLFDSYYRSENGEFLTCFDIKLDSDGYLSEYKQIGFNDTAEGDKWYAYIEYGEENPWYNNQAYINTLDKASIDKFIEVTYNAYEKAIGKDFGKCVPSIFTDEPQVSRKQTLTYAKAKKDVSLPWTPDLPQTFAAAYGEDLVNSVPELIWDLPDGKISTVRYHYHDHVCERFVSAFADNCGKWCSEHNLAFTGHMMDEPTLSSQTASLGETMRNYRSFGIPGIDMLCGGYEFTTAKQCQSAVHQYGKEAMLSELYGVTGWDFDFRGHKLHGDWQAALGVTLRVQHLAWVSMKGNAKRDFPASISYQSPWYTEYKNVEDHFARLNTALTRGKPIANVGVIHPIESYWLHWGPNDTSEAKAELDKNFTSLTEWLVKGTVDFDFISESLLPQLCDEASAPLKVGEMQYDVILVPACETLRSTTLERLEKFKAAGGKLVFIGNPPALENAVPSERGAKLYNQSEKVQFTRHAVLSAVAENTNVQLRQQNGAATEKFCHQLRRDGDKMWLFIARATEPYNKQVANSDIVDIYLNGEYTVEVYDTLTGEIRPQKCDYVNGKTSVRAELYDYDSLLLLYTPGRAKEVAGLVNTTVNTVAVEDVFAEAERTEIAVSDEVHYTLSEDNALLLDIAEYKLDDGEWKQSEELLRADNKLRKQLGIPMRSAAVAQPWVIPPEKPSHTVSLRFTVNSETEIDGTYLALEDAALAEIKLNGETVTAKPDGYYVDKSIEKVALPKIKRGANILEVKLPFGISTNIEWCYLLGKFGVSVQGRHTAITKMPETVRFGSITEQGFPFYGGNITYHIPLCCNNEDVTLKVPHYIGGLVTATLDGEKHPIIYPPYTTDFKLPKGNTTLDITLYGNRHNSFGAVHNADLKMRWLGPNSWYTVDDRWSYEYVLKQLGVISTPRIFVKEEV